MMQPALLGALFIGILSALPIVNLANCCCLWIVGGGLLAGHLEQQRDAVPLTAGRGALVGLLAGVFGAFVWLAAAIVLDVLVGPLQERMIADMIRNASDMPFEVREWLEMAGDRASAPLRLIAGFFLQLVVGAMFAPLGGVLAAVIWARRSPPPDPGSIPSPLPHQ